MFSQFKLNAPFPYAFKTPENLWFYGVFRGCTMRTLASELASSFSRCRGAVSIGFDSFSESLIRCTYNRKVKGSVVSGRSAGINNITLLRSFPMTLRSKWAVILIWLMLWLKVGL